MALTLGSFTLSILFSEWFCFVLSMDVKQNNPSLSPIIFFTNNAPLFPLCPRHYKKKWWLWGFGYHQ
ncbi:hypothetical protein GLYMA_10G048533v4 [Glycine max]|nr:hypothetical protein GLYMA_10G048533v4 [Glycine max]KAH1136796.1 hypothetical protein GYH30_026993 [Glycine max]